MNEKNENKLFFSYKVIHNTVQMLSKKIKESGFKPDLIVAIGTGGFIPARILKTYINLPILTVGLRYYDDNNKPISSPQKIQWIDEVERKLDGKKILLVDEIDDSRVTLAYCLKELLTHNPKQIAVAVLHLKKKKKDGVFPKEINNYFIGEEIEDKWVYYPWDATDITEHEKLC